jgi:hypothetical protein
MSSTQEQLLDELEQAQQTLLMKLGREIVPYLTEEDLLQPQDIPELENHPFFRYEEGVLAGIRSVRAALRAS